MTLFSIDGPVFEDAEWISFSMVVEPSPRRRDRADRRLNRYWPPVDVYSLRASPPVFLRLVGRRDCCLSDVRQGHIGRPLSGLAVVAAADRQSESTQDWKRNGSCQRARVLSQRSTVPAVAQA